MSRTRLIKALELAQSRSDKTGKSFAVILFCIDHFRLINHGLGDSRANLVLKRVSEATRAALGPGQLVGRWGSDEFFCLLPECGPREVAVYARAIADTIRGLAIPIDQHLINVTASIGTACGPDDGHTAQEIMNAADEALYEAKRSARDRTIAAGDLEQHVFKMGALLEAALREDRVVPAYQPIYDLATSQIVAEEALARIITIDGRVLGADAFIDAASQFGLTYKIDWTVLLSALTRHQDQCDNITHFVNICGDLLHHPRLLMELLASAKLRFLPGRSGTKPFVIEITERELLDNIDLTRERLAPFLDLGLQLALDDFGSGYSSFQYLADLPVSFLKIDGHLITRIDEPKVQSIIRGIQSVANDLNITTLAEYVETEEQVDILRRTGVHWAQGHYFGSARLDQSTADHRRVMSVNWTQGYYYQKHLLAPIP
ncbi:MAG TPA: bifunctional diguanylate cyclase/phosphodiesterase [Acidiferrobacter sp.]|nr:bifunctional diguanylate cyclase/phosphodiesterase [Acidiferrobacter sp.]